MNNKFKVGNGYLYPISIFFLEILNFKGSKGVK